MNSPPTLYTIDEAAAFLRISPRTIRRYIAAGFLPYVRMSRGIVRIRATDLKAFVDATTTRVKAP